MTLHSFLLLILGMALVLGFTPTPHAKAESSAAPTWREPATGLEFIKISGGCFTMGMTPAAEPQLRKFPEFHFNKTYADELPRLEACVDDFWMATRETSRAAWATLMTKAPFCRVEDDRLPVSGVSWFDALAFARELNNIHGGARRFRLPTEAEWEYACRAGGEAPYQSGVEALPAIGRFPNPLAKPGPDGEPLRGMAPVGAHEPNAFGLYDMHGNVEEWTATRYALPGETPPPETSRSLRVRKGGDYRDAPTEVRCGAREKAIGGFIDCTVGFRLIMVESASEPTSPSPPQDAHDATTP